MTTARERRLEAPGRLPLTLCEWGEPVGTPLVVLHGFLEQGAAWEEVAVRLNRWVIAPDQRGHGRSAHVGAGGFYHFWDYVGDVDGLVEQLGGPVDLLGHSMGGTVAALYAGARPEQVRRLILVEGLGPPDASAEVVDRARRFLADLRRPPRHRPIDGVAAAAERLRAWNPEIPEHRAAALAERLVDDGGWSWDARHRMRAPTAFQTAIFVQFLREITAPTLVIEGDRSTFRPGDLPERRAALRDARHLRLPAGHLPHHDCPAELAAALGAFLESP